MKQIATLCLFLLFFVLKINGQTTDATFAQPNTLDIVTWNMNWFGNLTYGPQTPANEYRQRQNAKTVLTTLAADIFELNEVCSLDSLSLLVAQMPGYSSVCCTETSYNSADGQRSCFVYKTAMFSNIKTKPLLKTIKDDPSVLVGYPVAGATGYTHFWSSGRLPFAMTADVTLNGATRRICLLDFMRKPIQPPKTATAESTTRAF